jgi:hypothetical protein
MPSLLQAHFSELNLDCTFLSHTQASSTHIERQKHDIHFIIVNSIGVKSWFIHRTEMWQVKNMKNHMTIETSAHVCVFLIGAPSDLSHSEDRSSSTARAALQAHT